MIAEMKVFGHDFFMGLALMASGVLTVAYTRSSTTTLRNLALIGAAVSFVIGLLLFLGLA